MTIDLSEIEFSYDFFSLPLPSGDTLIMNKVDESIAYNGEDVKIDAINIVVAKEDGSGNVLCSSVIGMSNDYFTLTSGYPEYMGKVLTSENMQYCTMELVEDE